MSNQHIPALETAGKKWSPCPDWIIVLATEVDRVRSRKTVGMRLGYSATTISQVISNHYPGNMAKLEDKVRGVFMGNCVNCPVLGPITTDVCRDYQELPFAVTSSHRSRLYRACRSGCPNSSLEKK